MLLLFQSRPDVKHTTMSFNEVLRTGENAVFSHHTYDGAKVDALAARLPPTTGRSDALLARFPPPRRALLPGDTCWQTQKHTEHCGSFSMAAVANYWYSRTNNPWAANGEVWVTRIDQLPLNIGTTPGSIVDAAGKWRMTPLPERDPPRPGPGRAAAQALALGGGAVIVNIIESGSPGFFGTINNRHFKTAVGYDDDRFFFQNSGIDWESRNGLVMPAPYTPRPPWGTTSTSSDFHPKWESTTEGVIGLGAGLFTSARTFIPVYPTEARFRGARAL